MDRPRALFIAPSPPARTGNGLAMRLGIFAEALARVADTELMIVPVAGTGDSALTAALGMPATTVPVAHRADTNFRLLTMMKDPAERLDAFRRWSRQPARLAFTACSAGHSYSYEGPAIRPVHTGRLYLAEAGRACPPGLIRSISTRTTLCLAPARAARSCRWQESRPTGAGGGRCETALLAATAERFEAMFIAGREDGSRIAARHRGCAGDRPQRRGFPSTHRAPGRQQYPAVRRQSGLAPNIEGLVWFVDRVLPRILARRTVRLKIVGRGPIGPVARLLDHPQIDLIGEVDNVADAYAAATPRHRSAPLRRGNAYQADRGGGVRYRPSQPRLLPGPRFRPASRWEADGPEAFAAAVLDALASPDERAARARRARDAARLSHDRSQIVDSSPAASPISLRMALAPLPCCEAKTPPPRSFAGR